MDISLTFFAFISGAFCLFAYLRLLDFWHLRKIKNEYNTIYTEILGIVGTKSCKFVSRYNGNVSFVIFTKLGKLDLIYYIDKKDVSIFRESECIYSSYYADKKLINDICEKLDYQYESDFSNCFNIMGNIIDIKTFQRLGSIVPNIVEDHKPILTIDSVLDKINDVGIENLSEEERKFLDNHK